MAYTTKKTFVTGTVGTAADMNTYVSDNVEWVYNLIKAWEGGVPSARVCTTDDIAIAGSADTAITFATEIFDTDEIWDVGAPTRLTCKTTGIYLITANAKFAVQQVWYIKHNGSTVIAQHNSSATGAPITLTTVYALTANDYVELFIHNSAGTSQNVEAESNYSPVFSMVYLGPAS